jgi:hypothetical protein
VIWYATLTICGVAGVPSQGEWKGKRLRRLSDAQHCLQRFLRGWESVWLRDAVTWLGVACLGWNLLRPPPVKL